MDNKQDRQFYWEVKDFMSKNSTPAPKAKPNTLVNAVTNVLGSSANTKGPNIYEAKQGIINSSRQTKHAVVNAIAATAEAFNKQKPDSKAYTNNITANPFNLFKR